MQAQYIQDVANDAGRRKARAFEVAMQLLEASSSDSVKARMVEFLAGESRNAPQVAVNISQNLGAGGYEYLPPGAQIVDVQAGTGDSKSPVIDAQATDNTGES
jgi:hypothetical protein